MECCNQLDQKKWDRKLHTWKNKLFVKRHYKSFFYIPRDLDKVISETNQLIKDHGIEKTPFFMLARNETFFGGDIYIEIKKKNSLPIDVIEGKFYSMFFEGKYKDMNKFIYQLGQECKKLNYNVKEILSFYATCPKCVKTRGKAQIVLFARIE